MWHACERRENVRTRFWWESPKERQHSEDRCVDGRMASELILGSLARGVRSGLNWPRIGTGGGML
jgi:hypothetical protein